MRRGRRIPKGSPPDPVLVKDVDPISEEQYPTARKRKALKAVGKKKAVNIIVQPGAKVEVKT